MQGSSNTYRLFNTPKIPDHIFTNQRVFTFSSTDPKIPLPDPLFLAIHAACVKVFHSSGVAEVIEKHMKDYETVPKLAKDGSSQLLEDALRMTTIDWFSEEGSEF